MYPFGAAGDPAVEPPHWLSVYEGPLTNEERRIYKKFLPEGVEYFDRAKKIFNVELRLPLTMFADKAGAPISFSQEWDMVVAEHVRAVIASERASRVADLSQDFSDHLDCCDSDNSLHRPNLDSSEDFTYTSEEDEEEQLPVVHPVAPIPKLYLKSNDNLVSIHPPSLYCVWPSNNCTVNHPRHCASVEPFTGIIAKQPPRTLSRPLLFYYHGRTPAFFKKVAKEKKPSHVPEFNLGLDFLSQDEIKRLIESLEAAAASSSRVPVEELYSVTPHFSFMMGPCAQLLYYWMRSLTRTEVKLVFHRLPLVPNMKQLLALFDDDGLSSESAGNLLRYLVAAAGHNPQEIKAIYKEYKKHGNRPMLKHFGIVGSKEWVSVIKSSRRCSHKHKCSDININNLSDMFDPQCYNLDDSIHCREELDIAIRKETVAAAKNLAARKFKMDIVQKLEESDSIELAEAFLKTPESVFALHEAYRKPSEALGVRSVPRHKVLPEAKSFVSESFITLEALGGSVCNSELDNFFVKHWSEALKLTEAHFVAHEETLRKLQDISQNEREDYQIISSHVSCLIKCQPFFKAQLEFHQIFMDQVACVLTIKERIIGERLKEALINISEYFPPIALWTNLVQHNSSNLYASNPSHEEFYHTD